jgi:hypothetical protein
MNACWNIHARSSVLKQKSDKQAEAHFEVLVNPRVGLIDYLFSGGGSDSCVLHGASLEQRMSPRILHTSQQRDASHRANCSCDPAKLESFTAASMWALVTLM